MVQSTGDGVGSRGSGAQLELVGRAADLKVATALLQAAALVSITGAHGVGKTALLSEALEGRAESIWVELAGLPPQAARARVRQAMGYRGQDRGEPVQTLLRGVTGLLVLDGADRCQTLCADLAAAVASGSGPARIVITTRRPLGIAGEVAWTLGPLGIPAPGTPTLAVLEESGSGDLLLRLLLRLGASVDDADAATLARACQDLGGLPLALHLFGPMVAALGAQDAARQVRQSRPGSGSEETGALAVGRALHLATKGLSAREIEVLIGLAEFPTGLGAKQIATVLGCSEHDSSELEAMLHRLLERSLLRLATGAGGARYRMDSAIASHLGADPRSAGRRSRAQEQRARWSLELVRGAESSLLTGSGQRAWLARLEQDEDNLRACLGAAIEAGQPETAGQLTVELWRYWELRGRLDEGRGWLVQVLAMPGLPAELRWRLLDGVAMLAWRQGDQEAALAALGEALQIVDRPGAGNRARLLHHLGLVRAFANQPEEAVRTLLLAAEGHANAGELGQVAMVHSTLGLVEASRGHLSEARAHLDRALGAGAVTRDSHAHAIAVLHLGLVATLESRTSEAATHLAEAALELLDLGDERSSAYAVLGLAAALRSQDPVVALTLAEAGGAAVERLGTPVPEPWASRVAEILGACWADVGDRAAELVARKARRLPLDQALAQAEPLLPRAPAEADGMSVRTMGSFSVRAGGTVVELVGQPAMLVKLLAASESQRPAEAVMEELWSGVDPKVGRWRLRNVLSRLHRAVPGLVARQGDRLDFSSQVEVDSRRFAALAQESIRRLRKSDPAGVQLGGRALGAFRGEFLPGDVYEEWAAAARSRLGGQRLRLLDELAGWALGHEDIEAAEAWLREAIDHDPWDERRYLRLAGILRSTHRSLAALEVLERAADTSRSAGLPPSPSLLRLVEELRSGLGPGPAAAPRPGRGRS